MKKVVWITGAGQGIGRAIAIEYAKRDWNVAISARTIKDLQSVVEEARAKMCTGSVSSYVLDVTDAEMTKVVHAKIEEELGNLDHVILNAGIHVPSYVDSLFIDDFKQLMNVNYFGCLNGLLQLIPVFLSRGAGQIAVMASVAGYTGLPNASAYGATKAALINLCESLRPQLEAGGVFLSLINPGFVKTQATAKNTFAMPFLMEPEVAAKAIYDGMEKKTFEIAFPWIFVRILKFLRLVPYSFYFWAIKKFVIKGKG